MTVAGLIPTVVTVAVVKRVADASLPVKGQRCKYRKCKCGKHVRHRTTNRRKLRRVY